MEVGHLHSCRHLFSLLLLLACLLGEEALSCQHVIHKKVGDSVELLACTPAEGVTIAKWKYGQSTIADKNKSVDEKQFTGRLKLDPTNFSLTVKDLRKQDSGEFRFLSRGSDGQRPTVTVTLKVHEPITAEPTLSGNSSGLTSTNSCMVLLKCSSNSGSEVSYNWTVGNETFQGPRLQHSIRAQDGDIKFTCTVFNPVSEKSNSYTVKCSSEPTDIKAGEKSPVNFTIVISVAGAILALLIIVGIAVCWHWKKRKTDSSLEDPTVYADITEVGYHNDPMKPNSEYETIGSRNFPVQSGPQTVYDKIQLNRLRKVSISPYQDIS